MLNPFVDLFALVAHGANPFEPRTEATLIGCLMVSTAGMGICSTTNRLLAELGHSQDPTPRGFIELVTKGAFSRKSPHASEWRLTFNTCNVTGELTSKAFMRWGREKQSAVLKYPVTVSNQATASHDTARKEPHGASN
jgi:hypothetical protein